MQGQAKRRTGNIRNGLIVACLTWLAPTAAWGHDGPRNYHSVEAQHDLAGPIGVDPPGPCVAPIFEKHKRDRFQLGLRQGAKEKREGVYRRYSTERFDAGNAASSQAGSGRERMLVAHVTPDRKNGISSTVISANLVVRGVAQAIQDRRYCERCSPDAVGGSAGDLTREVLKQAAIVKAGTVIELITVPTGAVVQIDGAMMGATNQAFTVAPGKHTIVLTREGYVPEVVNVNSIEGKQEKVELTLRKEASGKVAAATGATGPAAATATTTTADKAPEPAADKVTASVAPVAKPEPATVTGNKPLWPWALVVGGGAAMVAGGVIAFAQDDGDPTQHDQEETLFGSTPIGVGVGIAGAALVGTGVYFLLTDRSQESAPAVSFTSGGAMVGWLGRF